MVYSEDLQVHRAFNILLLNLGSEHFAFNSRRMPSSIFRNLAYSGTSRRSMSRRILLLKQGAWPLVETLRIKPPLEILEGTIKSLKSSASTVLISIPDFRASWDIFMLIASSGVAAMAKKAPLRWVFL